MMDARGLEAQIRKLQYDVDKFERDIAGQTVRYRRDWDNNPVRMVNYEPEYDPLPSVEYYEDTVGLTWEWKETFIYTIFKRIRSFYLV